MMTILEPSALGPEYLGYPEADTIFRVTGEGVVEITG
jgi:hypothetical protein